MFSSIVVSGEFGAAKPGTAIFDEALRHLGDPDRDGVLMVGDSLSSDIAGAEASGLSSCWYNPRGASTDNPVRIDHEIESLREVFAIAIG